MPWVNVVSKVVQASTRSVFGQRDVNEVYLTEKSNRRPVNPYGASKVGVTGEEKKAADSSRSRRGSSFMERRRSSVHESNDVSDLIGELTLGEMEEVEDLEVDDDFA